MILCLQETNKQSTISKKTNSKSSNHYLYQTFVSPNATLFFCCKSVNHTNQTFEENANKRKTIRIEHITYGLVKEQSS